MIESVGYAGTVDEVNEEQWSFISVFGTEYSVGPGAATGGAGVTDFKVTAVSGVDRTVRVAPGAAWGKGILDVSDANVDIALDSVGSGERWDTIVIRRNRSTKVTSVIKLSGSSARAISVNRKVDWADVGGQSVDDQPIALVRVVAGSTNISQILDLRCWGGNSGVCIREPEALGYLTANGSMVLLDGVAYSRQVNADGSVSWIRVVPSVEIVGATQVAFVGTYAGQRVKQRLIPKNYRSDANGDFIVMTVSEFAGILSPSMVATSTFPLTFSFRMDQGNLVGRVADSTGVRPNTTFAALADVLYW